MARQNLDALTDKLFGDVDDSLGDPILYTPDGAFARTVYGTVDYRETTRDLGVATMDQDILIEILTVRLTHKPRGADRINLPKYTTKIFKPNSDAALSQSGRSWVFTVKEVK